MTNVLKNKEANITVEAAFIVPIVIFVVITIIYFTFYLHDRVRLESVLERAFLKVSKISEFGYFNDFYKEQEIEVLDYLEEELKKGFFLLKKNTISCNINGFSIGIKIEMECEYLKYPLQNFGKNKKQIVLERNKILHNPQEVLRGYEGLQLIINDIDSFLFAKKQIEKRKKVIEESLQ